MVDEKGRLWTRSRNERTKRRPEGGKFDGGRNVAHFGFECGTGAATTFKNLPAIRFLADGTVDEDSPQMLGLTDGDGFARWLVETKNRTGYEISDTGK